MEMKGSSGVDDRTFRAIFGEEGVRKLRATLLEKLKEFMGEYTDDTLVEYVIVLLRNGRRKDEAKNELDVFLGDSTDFFVTWLWDHLVSNIDQYVLPPESNAEEVPKARPAKTERAGKNAPHNDTDPYYGTGMHEMSPKTRQPREWKGVSRKVALTSAIDCSDVGKSVRNEGRVYSEARHRKHSVSPEPIRRRKRSCAEEPRQSEESVPRGSIRLLQFAVRDAVASSRPFSVAGVPNPMEASTRSVVEASEDVKQKNKASGNVFDRLSRGVDEEESSRQVSTLMVDEFDDFNRIQEGAHEMDHLTTFYVGKYVGPMTWMEGNSQLASYYTSDSERYDGGNVMSRVITNVSSVGTSGTKKHYDSMMQNSVADNAIKARHPSHSQTPVSSVALANSSSKIVNISVNLKTWKPVHYQSSVGAKGQNSMQLGDTVTGNSRMTLLTGNSNFLKHAWKGNAAVEKQKSSPSVSGSYTVIPHLDDANSRTIFVNNVHFAASKDNLSRHFSKFGEVLKATILTDPATGQPKGSAYVEFVRKEVAEDALSLDGTSFMSRILKVVRKSAAHHETTRSTSFPPVIRGSTFAVPRIARATFPRVFHGAYRARPLLKPGARSLQWKRDAQPTSAEGPTSSSSLRSVAPSPFPRSLTYVRSELNADTNRIAT
ncbi:hypothetical protein Droror1_Dr00015988 [Drosera rotundifolia]